MTTIPSSRRGFLQTGAAFSGGLMLGVVLPAAGPARAAGLLHTPSAWVHIADDNTITLISARAEMGQGVYTSMPMLIAEELNVDIQSVKVAFAPPGKVYGNALIFGLQLTGGSTSVREGYDKLRLAGAQVREMLVAAAANQWKVDASTLKADKGVVTGPAGQRATYGQLAEAASKLPVPEKPALKDPSQFRIVGKKTTRLDTPAKVNGTANFGIDVKMPGMLYASIEMSPVQGGKLKSADTAQAKAAPGVVDVVQIPDGVAVVADTYWHAVKARKLLQLQWDEGANANLDTAAMFAGTQAALASGKPLPHKLVGDADAIIAASAKVVRAEYRTQNLSHAPMEPMNYTAHFEGDRIRLAGPTQWPDAVQGAVAKLLGLKPENVAVENTFLGGAFGRRIDFDYILQAAQIAKAVPNKPVKLIWSREDDMTHDYYRPLGGAPVGGGAGAGRQADGADLARGLAVGHRTGLRPAARGTRRPDDRGRHAALPHPGHPPGRGQARRRRARGLLARCQPQHERLCQRDLHRRMCCRRQARPGGLPPVAAGRRTAPGPCAAAGGQQGRLGHTGCGRALPGGQCARGLRHLHGPGGRGVDPER